jgi:hypothetical protein
MCTLAHLFSLPPVQDMLLEDLLPFDIARLLAATGCEITQVQRKKYMNPVRDVFDKHEEIALLTKAGVNIILLGHNAHLLHKRLNDTQSFVQKYGNRFEIDLIAIAYCHPDSSANAAHFPSIRFTVTDQVLENLGSRSDIAYSWLEHSLSMLPCTNSSLAPLATPPTSNIRLKQFKLNLRCCWFHTIDLVYPEETLGIFDWQYDEDVIETSATIVRHDNNNYTLYDTRCYGRWLPHVATAAGIRERGTPDLTRHRPNVNMQEVLVRLEIPGERAGIIRVPTPCWQQSEP